MGLLTPAPPYRRPRSRPLRQFGDDVPSVPRLSRPARPTARAQLASQLSGGDLAQLSYTTFTPSLSAQASSATLAGLLTATRTAINTKYYGFSTVDLQALHETWEARFRALRFAQAGHSQRRRPLDGSVRLGRQRRAHLLPRPAKPTERFRTRAAARPPPRRSFGFQFAAVPGEDGAVLIDVGAGTPAEDAGLKRGDTILSVNGAALTRRSARPTTTRPAPTRRLLGAAAKSGQSVTLGIRRGATLLSVAVTPRSDCQQRFALRAAQRLNVSAANSLVCQWGHRPARA